MSGNQPVGLSSLIGRRVVDKSGRTMGDVADTLVDHREGRVSHLVVRSASAVCYLPWRSVRLELSDSPAQVIIRHRCPARPKPRAAAPR